MDFWSRSGRLFGVVSRQCSVNTADSAEWPAQKSKAWHSLDWGWMRGHRVNVSQSNTNRKISLQVQPLFLKEGVDPCLSYQVGNTTKEKPTSFLISSFCCLPLLSHIIRSGSFKSRSVWRGLEPFS